MKKFVIFALTLALGASLLVGCGCMNTNADVTTLPTNGETSEPTRATTAPTTMPTTAPTTEATTEASSDPTDTTGTLEGAMDDIVGGSTDDTTMPQDAGRSRSGGNGPRMR